MKRSLVLLKHIVQRRTEVVTTNTKWMDASLIYAFPHQQIQEMEVGAQRQMYGFVFYFRNLVLGMTGVRLGGGKRLLFPELL